MIPNENAIVLFRFSEQRWIDTLINGELSFSCARAFVKQAIATDNEIQGDKYEGVFARLMPDDKRIEEMERLLCKDLEKINDNGYVLLRRRSALFKPIFCFYAYRAIDALDDGAEKAVIGENVIRHDFDPQMFSGFANGYWNCAVVADDRRFTVITLQPNDFIGRINFWMKYNNLAYVMKPVNYEIQAKETFFIEPTEKYEELFCKRPQYAYQHECRICLHRKSLLSFCDRYTLNIGQLSDREYNKTFQPFYFELKATIAKKDKSN